VSHDREVSWSYQDEMSREVEVCYTLTCTGLD